MSRRRCKQQLVKFLQHLHRLLTGTLSTDNEDEEQEGTVVRRRRPEDLERLHSQSRFSKRELQILYRGFKSECPTGIVTEDTFKNIYAQFFPGGDVSKYAHHLFSAFDADQSGLVSFEELVRGLSVLLRGSTEEKLYWTFNLYDLNRDGQITKQEMLEVLRGIYDLMGRNVPPGLKEEAPRLHLETFFQKMDRNQDGVVTAEEFIDTCQKVTQLSYNPEKANPGPEGKNPPRMLRCSRASQAAGTKSWGGCLPSGPGFAFSTDENILRSMGLFENPV